MEFTCPHCGKTFEQKTRKPTKSEKAKEASRRNLEAGGYNRKAQSGALAKIYMEQCEEWTWEPFVKRVKEVTGAEYSRAQAFVWLKRFRTMFQKPESKSAFISFTTDGRTISLDEQFPVGKKKPAKK